MGKKLKTDPQNSPLSGQPPHQENNSNDFDNFSQQIEPIPQYQSQTHYQQNANYFPTNQVSHAGEYYHKLHQ